MISHMKRVWSEMLMRWWLSVSCPNLCAVGKHTRVGIKTQKKLASPAAHGMGDRTHPKVTQ